MRGLAWSGKSISSITSPSITSAGLAWASGLEEGLPWKNKDKDQNEISISKENYLLAAPGIRELGAGGPRGRAD